MSTYDILYYYNNNKEGQEGQRDSCFFEMAIYVSGHRSRGPTLKPLLDQLKN